MRFLIALIAAVLLSQSLLPTRTHAAETAKKKAEKAAAPDDRGMVVVEKNHNGRKVAGIELVSVPGGCFQMGCGNWASDCDDDEKPVHKVCVGDFSIGKYEVTQGQWKKVMGSNPSYFSSCGDDCPVENVSWDDVQEFIAKLNQQTGGHFRLPTEAEWEYACRSGGKNEKYCGSDHVDAVAWYGDNSGTHQVGRKQPNGLGIFDMSGNVWEWVGDRFGSYSSSRQQDPRGPSTGSDFVVRGGGWRYDAREARVTCRAWGVRNNLLGFRLASPAVHR